MGVTVGLLFIAASIITDNEAENHLQPYTPSDIEDRRPFDHAFFCNAHEAKSGTIAIKALGTVVDFLGPATVLTQYCQIGHELGFAL